MWKFEQELFAKGITVIAGVDEAGRGPLAGPVVAAAVILPRDVVFEAKIADSKKLTQLARKRAYAEIREKAAVGIGMVGEKVIDRINILQAALLAMQQAVGNLPLRPQWALIDGPFAPKLDCATTAIVNGDNLSVSIAAASIIAKVKRDEIMDAYETEFPGYGFSRHKGYGTRGHIVAMEKLGISSIHRRSFQPVKRLLTGA